MLKYLLVIAVSIFGATSITMAGTQTIAPSVKPTFAQQPALLPGISPKVKGAEKLNTVDLASSNIMTIDGEITLGNAPLSVFYFKLDGRPVTPADVHFSNIGGEFSNRYHFNIKTLSRASTTGQSGAYTLEPSFTPAYSIHGQWNPRNTVFRITPVNRVARNIVFRWVEATNRQTVSTALVVAQIRGALRGLRIHLNNHGPQHPDTVHDRSWQHNDSHIEFQGGNFPLALQEIGKKVGARHYYYYYVNDFNLSNVDVSTERNLIRIAFNFEDQGPEVKGHCLIKRAKKLGGWSACPVGSDQAAPDIHLTHPTFVAYVQPVAFDGSISFGDIDIRYTGGVHVNGVAAPISGIATQMMRNAVQSGLSAMISRGLLRSQIANVIRQQVLNGLHIGYVTSVRLDGNNIYVTSRN